MGRPFQFPITIKAPLPRSKSIAASSAFPVPPDPQIAPNPAGNKPNVTAYEEKLRLIPMAENLFAWLAPYRGKSGRICERWHRPQALVQAFDRFGKSLGVEVGANKFRNSFISYRVAVTHDVQRVALESGNSPRVIQREYLELATEDVGKQWFNIFPPAAKAACPTEPTTIESPPRMRKRP